VKTVLMITIEEKYSSSVVGESPDGRRRERETRCVSRRVSVLEAPPDTWAGRLHVEAAAAAKFVDEANGRRFVTASFRGDQCVPLLSAVLEWPHAGDGVFNQALTWVDDIAKFCREHKWPLAVVAEWPTNAAWGRNDPPVLRKRDSLEVTAAGLFARYPDFVGYGERLQAAPRPMPPPPPNGLGSPFDCL